MASPTQTQTPTPPLTPRQAGVGVGGGQLHGAGGWLAWGPVAGVGGAWHGKRPPPLNGWLTGPRAALPRSLQLPAGRAQRPAGPFKEALVFMVGGGNYLEYESLRWVAPWCGALVAGEGSGEVGGALVWRRGCGGGRWG